MLSPLRVAVMKGKVEVMRHLMQRYGARFDERDKVRTSLLPTALFVCFQSITVDHRNLLMLHTRIERQHLSACSSWQKQSGCYQVFGRRIWRKVFLEGDCKRATLVCCISWYLLLSVLIESSFFFLFFFCLPLSAQATHSIP
jgi:hypothetical protein